MFVSVCVNGVCASPLSFLDGQICAMQEPSIIIISEYIYTEIFICIFTAVVRPTDRYNQCVFVCVSIFIFFFVT